MRAGYTFAWLTRLLVLFPLAGAATGVITCKIADVEVNWGIIFGAIEGAIFGAMICWPTIQIPFWKIILFTASGTILFGGWGPQVLDVVYLATIGFWVGFLALWLYFLRTDPQRIRAIP